MMVRWMAAMAMMASCCEAQDLFTAARSNDAALAGRLLAMKVDPNQRDEKGHTPLAVAAYHGSLGVVEALVGAGADVNLQDRMGTPLMAASFKGDTAVMKRLIASGARVDARNGIGATALMFAALAGKLEAARLLLRHKADARAVDGRGLDANALAEGQGNGAMTGLLKRAVR